MMLGARSIPNTVRLINREAETLRSKPMAAPSRLKLPPPPPKKKKKEPQPHPPEPKVWRTARVWPPTFAFAPASVKWETFNSSKERFDSEPLHYFCWHVAPPCLHSLLPNKHRVVSTTMTTFILHPKPQTLYYNMVFSL